MNRRSWAAVGPIVLVALSVGSGFVLWAHGFSPNRPHANSAGSVVAGSPDVLMQEPTGRLKIREPQLQIARSAPLALRMDETPAGIVSTPAPTSREVVVAPSGENPQPAIARIAKPGSITVPNTTRSLNLAMPNESENIDSELPVEEDKAIGTEAPATLAFDSGAPQPGPPDVPSFSLFNPEYGLRGFMKQSWVNNSFGVQGGLGLNDGRRLASQGDDLQDDIAVGMGVILAF